MKDNKTTHFGFKKVPIEEKASKVADVFHSVAGKYDVMNDLMSGGVHRLWKRYTISLSGVRDGQSVLDVAGGTGDLTAQFSKIVGNKGKVILLDINESMLKIGRDKLIDMGSSNQVFYALGDAQNLPFPDNTFDCITIAFGLRNVTDRVVVLKEIFRILKPGGRFICLEFSHVENNVFKAFYDLWSFKFMPIIGENVTGDKEAYSYLVESIRKFPNQNQLSEMFSEAGFSRVRYRNLSNGIVSLHSGWKI